MIVLVLSACPAGLRGHLTRWLIEVAAGVFVGRASARVRELLWLRTIESSRRGRALMIYQDGSEQGMTFRTHGHHWQPTDFDGITLMMRRIGEEEAAPLGYVPGWSKAAKRRMGR